MTYLLDTCALYELVKPNRDDGLIAWLATRSEEGLFTSVVSLGEITKGLARLTDDFGRRRIRKWIDGELKPRFGDRLLGIDAATAEVWGELCGEAERRGAPLPVMDAWIAAIARVHQLTVVTRNVAEMERCGATVVNPWSGVPTS